MAGTTKASSSQAQMGLILGTWGIMVRGISHGALYCTLFLTSKTRLSFPLVHTCSLLRSKTIILIYQILSSWIFFAQTHTRPSSSNLLLPFPFSLPPSASRPASDISSYSVQFNPSQTSLARLGRLCRMKHSPPPRTEPNKNHDASVIVKHNGERPGAKTERRKRAALGVGVRRKHRVE